MYFQNVGFVTIAAKELTLQNPYLLCFRKIYTLSGLFFYFVPQTCNICLYLILLIFLGAFDQTPATEGENYLWFSYIISQYVF